MPLPDALEEHKFDSERARAAGKKSAEARRARALAERASHAAAAGELAEHLEAFRQAFQRNDLGPNAATVGNYILSLVVLGKVPIRHAGDAADLLRVVVDVARLEEGQATSHTLTMDGASLVARIEQLRAELAPPPPAIEAEAD